MSRTDHQRVIVILIVVLLLLGSVPGVSRQTEPGSNRKERRDNVQHSTKGLDQLRATGIGTIADLRAAVRAQKRHGDLVERLIRRYSLNLLVGDSGIGETPLLQLLALCVVSGLPFLGGK